MQSFSFSLLDGSGGGLTWDTTIVSGNSADIRRDETGIRGRYRARLSVWIKDAATLASWTAFVLLTLGAQETWLFKEPIDTSLYRVTDEAAGTGTGSLQDFPLVFKHVDAATVVVKDNGSTVSSSNYTLNTNNTTPTIHFTTPPTSGHAITVSYEYFIPVEFTAPPPTPQWISGGLSSRIDGAEVAETYGGARYVNG